MNPRLTLSFVLVLLGLILAFLPLSGRYSFHGKPARLIPEMMDEGSFFTPDQVARFVVTDDSTVQLIDLRTDAEFNSFSIPGAINIPYGDLLSADLESYLNRGVRNIFYGNGDYLSNYAFMIAKGLGYSNCYVMKGGLNNWYEMIMNSTFSGERISARENALYETRTRARRMFLEINSMPDSLKSKYREALEIERKKLDGGCE